MTPKEGERKNSLCTPLTKSSPLHSLHFLYDSKGGSEEVHRLEQGVQAIIRSVRGLLIPSEPLVRRRGSPVVEWGRAPGPSPVPGVPPVIHTPRRRWGPPPRGTSSSRHHNAVVPAPRKTVERILKQSLSLRQGQGRTTCSSSPFPHHGRALLLVLRSQ